MPLVLKLSANVPAQRPADVYWMLALYSSPDRCSRLLDGIATLTEYSNAPIALDAANNSKLTIAAVRNVPANSETKAERMASAINARGASAGRSRSQYLVARRRDETQ